MDWSEDNLCIKCDKNGNLLFCSENGCPLALHEKCLGFPARLDDEGRFYCPYCSYKQAVAELRRAREFASARKKALSVFMDEKKSISGEKNTEVNKTCEENGHNQLNTGDRNVHVTSCDDAKSNSNINGTIDQPHSPGEEEKMEEDSEDLASSEAQDASHDRTGDNGNITAEVKQVNEEERETSGDKQSHEEGCETLRDERIQEKEHETSVGKEIEEEERESLEEQIQEEEHGTFGEKHAQEGENETSGGKESEEEERESSVEEQVQEEEHETIGEKHVQEGEHETSGGKQIEEEERETCVEEQIQEGQRETSVEEEEEKICEEEPEASSASMEEDPSLTRTPRAKRLSNGSKPVEKDSEAIPMQSEPLKNDGKKKKASPMTPTRRSGRRSLPDSKMHKEVKKEFASPERSMKREKPPNRIASNEIRSPKRKRLMWTEEEEEALRKGVKKYSKPDEKIPWRKILESSDKFDSTRNPVDLKDKWRNMAAR